MLLTQIQSTVTMSAASMGGSGFPISGPCLESGVSPKCRELGGAGVGDGRDGIWGLVDESRIEKEEVASVSP